MISHHGAWPMIMSPMVMISSDVIMVSPAGMGVGLATGQPYTVGTSASGSAVAGRVGMGGQAAPTGEAGTGVPHDGYCQGSACQHA